MRPAAARGIVGRLKRPTHRLLRRCRPATTPSLETLPDRMPGSGAIAGGVLDRLRTRGDGDAGDPAGDDVDPRTLLAALGIVRERPDGAGLALTGVFREAWRDAVRELAVEREDLRTGVAALAGTEPERIELARRPGSFDAVRDGAVVRRWPSKAACQADVAGAAIFPLFDPEWGRRPGTVRWALLAMVRLFLEHCPTCTGRVELERGPSRSRRRHAVVVAATCRACDARVFQVELDAPAVDGSTDDTPDRARH